MLVGDQDDWRTRPLGQLHEVLQLQLGLVQPVGAVEDEQYEVGVSDVAPPEWPGLVLSTNVPQVKTAPIALNLKNRVKNCPMVRVPVLPSGS